jgi:septal ring factor EnvC (AmiA/AmiB activator)
VIIEDDSFALGMPTPMEMLEQHALLLQGENEQLQQGLSRARKNIEKLVAINQTQADQITQLNSRIERLTWDLSRVNVELTELTNRQLGGPSPTWGGMPPESYQG